MGEQVKMMDHINEYQMISDICVKLNQLDIDAEAMSIQRESYLGDIWILLQKIPKEDRKEFMTHFDKAQQEYSVEALANYVAKLYIYGGEKHA